MLKKILVILGSILLILGIIFYETVFYLSEQGYGQIRILAKSESILKVLENKALPDSMIHKIKWIQIIRQFAFDSLGLNRNNNYTTFYNQEGKPILWVVTASEKYKIVAYKYIFPIAGAFEYKGFFDKKDAIAESNRMQTLGYDTHIGEVQAWSTLGYFSDPILSNMLDDNIAELSKTIIHELTHGTIYVKNNAELSENLATFVGEYGAKWFLSCYFGKNSVAYKNFENELTDKDLYTIHFLRGIQQLDSLYQTFEKIDDTKKKDSLKVSFIEKIIQKADTLPFYNKTRFRVLRNSKNLPNNAWFSGFKTYRNDLKNIQKDFETKFNSDFKKFLLYLKNNHSSL